jgi:hypothetical protein
MKFKAYTYNKLISEKDKLLEQKANIMDECIKNNLSYLEFMDKAKPICEELFYISREIRLRQTPTLQYGKTWNGNTLTIEDFIKNCENGIFTDENGIGYYATDNAKSNILAYPSDFNDKDYRTDFTHIIWFNKV